MKKRFIPLIAVGALILGSGLSACETVEPTVEEIHHYGVSILGTEHGQVTTKTTSALVGEEVVLKVSPDEGYLLKELKVNNEDKTSEVKDNQLKTTMVENGLVVSAVFELQVYKVNIVTDNNGTVEVSKTEGYTGEEVVFTIIPNFGFEFSSLLVNDVDKTDDVVDGVYKTAFTDKNITFDVEFSALQTNGDKVKQLKKLLSAHENDEKEAIKVVETSTKNVRQDIIELNNYHSEEEGDYTVTKSTAITKVLETERKTIELTKMVLNEDNSLFKVTKTLSEENSQPQVSKQPANELNKNLLEFVKSGKSSLNTHIGAIPDTIVNDAIEFDITVNDEVATFKYVEFQDKSIAGATPEETLINQTYTTYDCKYEFKDGKLARVTTNKVGYKNDAFGTNFTVDETGKKITLVEGAKKDGSSFENVTEYTYGNVPTEPEDTKLPSPESLLIQDYDFEVVDNLGTQAQKDSSGTFIIKATDYYKIKLKDILPAGNNQYGDRIVSYSIPDNYKSLVAINSDYFTGDLNVRTMDVVDLCPITVNTINTTKVVNISAIREAVTSLTLYAEGDRVQSKEVIGLALEANHSSCDTRVAFEFVGDDLGCKVIYNDNLKRYELVTGEKTGTVTLEAISITDSTIRSNQITIEITAPETFDDILNGVYQADQMDWQNPIQFYDTIELSGNEKDGGKGVTYENADGVAFRVVTLDSGEKVLEFESALTITGSQNYREKTFYINKLYYNDSIPSFDQMTGADITVKGFTVKEIYTDLACTKVIADATVNLMRAIM